MIKHWAKNRRGGDRGKNESDPGEAAQYMVIVSGRVRKIGEELLQELALLHFLNDRRNQHVDCSLSGPVDFDL